MPIDDPTSLEITLQQRDEMISTLTEFRKRCQRLYFAFDGLSAGRRLLVDHYQETLKPEYRNVDFALAYQVNNDPNNIDLSPVAVMKQGELIEATLPGGEFENINHQAVVVFVYHLWDELYRPQIAKIVQVENKKVEWDLLGDLKLIRNAIIHNQSKLPIDLLPMFVPPFMLVRQARGQGRPARGSQGPAAGSPESCAV